MFFGKDFWDFWEIWENFAKFFVIFLQKKLFKKILRKIDKILAKIGQKFRAPEFFFGRFGPQFRLHFGGNSKIDHFF